MSKYIICVFRFRQSTSYYGFREKDCNVDLMKEIIQARDNGTCPPLEDCDSYHDTKQHLNFDGDLLQNGSIDEIPNVAGQYSMRGLEDVTEIVIIDFCMHKYK